MWNAGLEEAQAGIKIARRNINNLRFADNTNLIAESKEELKSLLMKVKEESEKPGLKLNIQNSETVASGPNHFMANRWRNNGNSDIFIFLGSKITADGDCSHEIKRHLLLRRKAITNLDSILKNRDIFSNKGPSSQSYGFSSSHVWMWELEHKEGWAPKDWCFWTLVLENTLESPLDCMEIKSVNHKGNSILNIPKLKLKLQYFCHLCKELSHWEWPWCWERLKAEQKGMRGWDGWIASLTHWFSGQEFEQALGDGEAQGSLACFSLQSPRVGHDWVTEQQQERRECLKLKLQHFGHLLQTDHSLENLWSERDQGQK